MGSGLCSAESAPNSLAVKAFVFQLFYPPLERNNRQEKGETLFGREIRPNLAAVSKTISHFFDEDSVLVQKAFAVFNFVVRANKALNQI